MKQFLWIPKERRVVLEKEPKQVWTIIKAKQSKNQQPYPDPEDFHPIHNHNAFLEDKIHDWDWNILSKVFRYYSRISDGNVWVLLVYEINKK